MSEPLIKLDVIKPRIKLLEHFGKPWQKEYEDWPTFREYLFKLLDEEKCFNFLKTAPTPNRFDSHLRSTSSCGVQELTYMSGDISTASGFAQFLVWAVANFAPNFVYYNNELMERIRELLEEFGWTYVIRSYNLVHNHYCYEFRVAYDYADMSKHPDKVAPGTPDTIAYKSYHKLTLTRSAESRLPKPRIPRQKKLNVDKELTLP